MRSARKGDQVHQEESKNTLYRRMLAVMAVMAVATGAVLMAVGMVAAQESTDPSATRAFDTMSVAAGGGPVVATITVSGATQAVVTETLPTGFAYVESSLPAGQVTQSDHQVRTRQPALHGDRLRGGHGGPDRVDVTGHDGVTVGDTDPSATRAFDTMSTGRWLRPSP